MTTVPVQSQESLGPCTFRCRRLYELHAAEAPGTQERSSCLAGQVERWGQLSTHALWVICFLLELFTRMNFNLFQTHGQDEFPWCATVKIQDKLWLVTPSVYTHEGSNPGMLWCSATGGGKLALALVLDWVCKPMKKTLLDLLSEIHSILTSQSGLSCWFVEFSKSILLVKLGCRWSRSSFQSEFSH